MYRYINVWDSGVGAVSFSNEVSDSFVNIE